MVLNLLRKKNKMVKIIIMVDDINPIDGYKPNQNMLDLIKDYGCKFNLFIPADFKNKLDADNIDEWIENPNFELCAHGLNHDTNEEGTNAEEFKDLDEDEIKSKMDNINQIWLQAGYSSICWKSPGWSTPLYLYKYLKEYNYDILIDHMKNDGFKEYNGIKRIGYDYSIDDLPKVVTKDLLILQSHISDKGGSKNIWNNENTLKFKLWLETLDKVEFIFIGDLI